MHWWNGWGPMMGMGLFWILLLVAVVVLVVWIVRRSGAGGASPPRPSAEDILRERLARGEIDSEEYEKRQALLRR